MGQEHNQFMRQAIRLAERARGLTSPNPMVGAVLVRDGEIVGEGYHHRAGDPHAEVEALRAAGERARGAAMYVNLEPCNHHGRTPPCVDAILSAGVARVIYGCGDPHAQAAGGGARLAKRGVEVIGGVLEDESERLNEAFLKSLRTGLPFVILKAGMSLDGKIAGAARRREQITGETATRAAHRLRADCDAVMVGIGTVVADDPQLTVRHCDGPFKQPLRVVIDSRCRTPESAAVISQDPSRTVIACGRQAAEGDMGRLRTAGAAVERFAGAGDGVDLEAALRYLSGRGALSVLVEGGARLSASLLREGLVDKVVLFVAPVLAGGDALSAVDSLGVEWVSEGVRLRDLKAEPCGGDLRIEAYVERNA